MGYMELTLDLMLAIVFIVIVTAVVLTLVYSQKILKKKAEKDASTEFLDEDRTCGICFGDLGNTVAECTCGKRFHETCAEPTGSCPYCKASYEKFKITEERRHRCPNCGRYPLGRVCKCGAVFPLDGALLCKCGSPVNMDTMVCTKCGLKYKLESSS